MLNRLHQAYGIPFAITFDEVIMEMKNSTRNRWLGYFGLAVATLLTPAGKLISSAVAAAATVTALINMSGPEVDMEMSPVPAHATSSDHIDEYITNELATVSDQSIMEQDSDFLETHESGAAMTLSAMPPAGIIATNSSTGPSGGGLSNAPSTGPMSGPGMSGPGPISRGDPRGEDPSPIKLDCTEILKKDASEISDLEKALCDPIVTKTTPDADIPPDIVADSKPSSPAETTIPTEPSNPAETTAPTKLSNPAEPSIPTELVNLPKIAELDDLPPTIIPASDPVQTHRTISDDSRSTAVITAIPEPSTLGLMLLGMLGLVWIYRRSVDI